MALPQKAIELNEKRLAVVAQIEELKGQARALKREMDFEIERANMLHKLGGDDLEKVKALLGGVVPFASN